MNRSDDIVLMLACGIKVRSVLYLMQNIHKVTFPWLLLSDIPKFHKYHTQKDIPVVASDLF